MYRQVDLLTVQWSATKNPRESWEREGRTEGLHSFGRRSYGAKYSLKLVSLQWRNRAAYDP